MEVALPLSRSGAAWPELTAAWQLMAEAARAGDAFAENDAHQQFHIEVVALAGQRHLLMAFEPVILKLQLLMAANLRLETEHGGTRTRASRGTGGCSRPSRPVTCRPSLDALAGHGARTYIG